MECLPGATLVERLLSRHEGQAHPVGRWAARAQVISSWLDRDVRPPPGGDDGIGPGGRVGVGGGEAGVGGGGTGDLGDQSPRCARRRAAFDPGWSPRSHAAAAGPGPTRRRRGIGGSAGWRRSGYLVAGFLSLVSALAEPLRDRINFLNQLFPIAVPETAAALAALGGIGLIILARGIRRGQRRAWAVCFVILGAITVLHLLKGIRPGRGRP